MKLQGSNLQAAEYSTPVPVPQKELSDTLREIIEILKEAASVQIDTCMLLAKEGDGIDPSQPECLLEAVDIIEKLAVTVRAKAYQIHRIVK